MSEVKSDTSWISGQARPGIVTIGDPHLKLGSRDVTDLRAVAPILDKMVLTLRELNGAGLAAPQLGEPIKAVVIEVRRTDVFPDRPETPLMVMVNPQIVSISDATESGWEGCFSVPGIMGVVPRSNQIEVKYLSPAGALHQEQYDGYVARVIQHEIDHLSGIEFLNRMTSLDSLTTVQNYLEFHRAKDPD